MKTNIIKIGIISLLGLGTVSGVVLTKQIGTHTKEATAATNLTTYYQNADTSSPTALLNSLKKGGSVTTINTLGYNGLWNAYKTTDIRSDGKICDPYSNTTNYTPGTDQDQGSHSKEGDTYNREHSIPKSWWGGPTPTNNQGCDIFIVYPTDSYVNERRSNYPYGEVGTISYASNNNYSLLGTSNRSGYTGTVFEPADEWKGDFARVYFYAIATYTTTSWTISEGSLIFDSSISSPNYGLTDYAKNLFLEWNSQDPVSQWERDRNDKGQSVQGNRNPFIDHPEWVDFIWNDGSLTSKTLTSISKSGSPSKTTYTAGETFNPNGLTITATYSDGSTANVTNSLTWTPSPLTQGTTSVTGTYTYGGVSKTVTVTGLTVNAAAPKTLTSIAVSGQKTNYSVGDAFVKPVVTATYSDGSTENVTDSATFTGYDMSTPGTQTVTVTYQGFTLTYTITVTDPSAIHGKTISDPLTVTEAIAMAGNEEAYYVRGLISKIDEAYSSTYHNTTFWITDDESIPQKFQLYRIYHETDPGIALGYDVIVEGKIVFYNSTKYEMTNASGGGIERLISIEEKADSYASAFNSAKVCGTDNYTPAIASKWSEQRIAFQALDSYTKNYLKDVSIENTTEAISECIARYERVLELHGEDIVNFPDFMNRNVVNSSKAMVINNQDAISMVVIISLVGTSFAFCFVHYKRKKKFN